MGATGKTSIPALAAHCATSVPADRGSKRFGCGAGSGTGDAETGVVPAASPPSAGAVRTARTTFGVFGLVSLSVDGVSGAGDVDLDEGDACSTSQRAQQMVLRTHSGEPPAATAGVDGWSWNGMSSQSTKASSR